ncbi:MAG: DUF4384 domain-containing protein [Gemmatimonadales bacterium]
MLIPLLLIATPAVTRDTVSAALRDPPIRVSLNSDGKYIYGDRAKVQVQAAEDGYLVVLRSDAKGNVRLLSPLDPGDDQQVRGGKKYQVKGRGGREAFVVQDSAGQGVVLAAWSKTPFNVEQYERNGHWNYDALSDASPGLSSSPDDPEAQLLSVVDGMKSSGDHYDYDVTTYVAWSPRYARAGYAYPYAWPGWWGYDPWYGGPFLSTRILIGSRGFGFGRRRR